MKEEISFAELIQIIIKKKYRILVFAVLCSLISFFHCLYTTKTYQASAKVLPLGAGQLNFGGGMAALASMGAINLGGMSIGQPLTQLSVLLESRALAERVVDRMDLDKRLYSHLWDSDKQQWNVNDPSQIPKINELAGYLLGTISIVPNEKGFFYLFVESEDPQLSYDIIKELLSGLQDFINENEFTTAKKHRFFIGQQLQIYKKKILNAGIYLANFYEKNEVSPVNANVDVDIDITSFMQSEKNVESAFDNKIYSDLKTLKSQDDRNKEQLKKSNSVINVPQQVYLDYLSVQKQVLAKLILLLEEQYQMAMIKEKEEEISFQILDAPLLPTSYHRPKTRTVVMFTFFISFVLGIFYTLFRYSLANIFSSSARE